MPLPLITGEELQELGYSPRLIEMWEGVIDRAEFDRRVFLDLHELFINLIPSGEIFGGPSVVHRALDRCDWELVRTSTGRQPENKILSPVPDVSTLRMSEALDDLFRVGVHAEMEKLGASVMDETHVFLALMNACDPDFLDFLKKIPLDPLIVIRYMYSMILDKSKYCDIAPPQGFKADVRVEGMGCLLADAMSLLQECLLGQGLDKLPIREIIVVFD